jgi:hypothetical protein
MEPILALEPPVDLGGGVWLIRLVLRGIPDEAMVGDLAAFHALVPSGATRLLLVDVRGNNPHLPHNVRTSILQSMWSNHNPSRAVAVVTDSRMGRLMVSSFALATRRVLIRAFESPDLAEAWLRKQAQDIQETELRPQTVV